MGAFKVTAYLSRELESTYFGGRRGRGREGELGGLPGEPALQQPAAYLSPYCIRKCQAVPIQPRFYTMNEKRSLFVV